MADDPPPPILAPVEPPPAAEPLAGRSPLSGPEPGGARLNDNFGGSVAVPPDYPRRQNLDNDLGFGSVVARESRRRLLNPDGSFNVVREGLGPVERLAPYHTALTMRWPRFLAYLTAAYLGVNLVFAVAYWLCGPDALVDTGHTMDGNAFVRAFFFSVETFGTIGYGAVAPKGVAANTVVTVEALVSILAVAIFTGLIFARFSRPTARVRFSRRAIIAPFGGEGGRGFMFRLVNERSTELLNLEVRVLFARFVEQGGRRLRRFDQLALERERVVFFPLAWTVVHPITPDSPVAGFDRAEMERVEAEFLVLLSAVDETNAQTVHARTSYTPAQIVEGVRFANLFNPTRPDGTVSINVSQLDGVEPEGAAPAAAGARQA